MHHQDALVIVDCLTLPADTPAQNLCGSTVSTRGGHPCTSCQWGSIEGTGPTEYRRQMDGVKQAIEVKLKTLQRTLAETSFFVGRDRSSSRFRAEKPEAADRGRGVYQRK